MKIIMPVAGKGTRLKPHTHVTPKALIRVAGKAIISHIIDQFSELDISEVIFIIGHLGDQIRNQLTEDYDFPMRFVRQTEYNGLGHAIYQARDAFDDDEDILVLLGDIIFSADLKSTVSVGENSIGVMEVEDPTKFGIVEQDEQGYIKTMIEKPENPPSNLAIAGIYYFKSSRELFDSIGYLIENNLKTRGEYQLTDAMRNMMNNGTRYKTFRIPEWFDCGEKKSLLSTNNIMLKRYGNSIDAPGCIIVPPVYIGKDVFLKNSIIGPNVSISDNSSVINSIIKESIVGEGAFIENTILSKSLIGDNVYFLEAAREFNIGPDSEIILAKKPD